MFKFIQIGIFGLLFLFAFVEFLLPPMVVQYYRSEYQNAMFQCDHVMREHFIAKKAVEHAPSDVTIKNLDAAEIGLLVCQDYDRLRKRLGTLGVSDSQLGLLGLEALEKNSKDVRRFVEIHEIRY